MKIIKQGDLNVLKTTRRLECWRCGCVFEVGKDECKYTGSQYNESVYSCKCPCCGESLSFDETL